MKKLLICIGVIFCITGCASKHEFNDIEKYLNEYDVFKISGNSFSVSDTSFQVHDEDGYTDEVWEVNATVDDEKIVFYVIDNFYWGMESTSNSLVSTYNYQAYLNATKNLNLATYKFSNEPEYLSSSNGHISSDVLEELNIGVNGFSLQTNYYDWEELANSIDHIYQLVTKTSKTEWKPNLCFDILYFNQYRNNVKNYELDEADFKQCYSEPFDLQKVKENAKKEYILMNLDYRFVEVKDMFSEKEIDEAISTFQYRVGIIDESSLNGFKVVPNLVQNKYSYGISFGTLYELLKWNSQKVVGNEKHFIYYKDNGDVYEFSYDFNDEYYEETSQYGYYYLLNGKKVKMDYYFYNHFKAKEVEKITGIPVVNVYYNAEKGFYM